MAANLSDHMPIRLARTVSNLGWQINGFLEKATQTFLAGTPCQLSAGLLRDWDGATVAAGILGVVLNDGSNLSSDGKGAPSNSFGSVGSPAATPLFTSKIPNQASAVSIPHGAQAVDGRNLVCLASGDAIFEAQIDNNTGASFTLTQADIGTAFGMTKDTTGHWYVDRAKTAGNAVCVILGPNPVDGLIANARVYIKFLSAAIQILA